jgi:FkbM family methyltransferase
MYVRFSIIAETVYGPMILHRLDEAQGTPAIRTGKPIGFNEILMLRRIISRLSDKPVFLDIGSNVGFFSVALARDVGPEGRVYAFEGQRIISNMLAGSIALNAFLNVVCINACVGSTIGSIELPSFDYNSAMSFGSIEFGPDQKEPLRQQRRKEANPERVPLITIDSLNLPKVSMMKVDVEGMELDVFDGATRTIERDRPVIFVEFLKSGFEPLKDYLTARGYFIADVGGFNMLALPTTGPNRFEDPASVVAELTRPPTVAPADFSPSAYLKLHLDVAEAGMDPTNHYLKYGWAEGRAYR